MENIFNVEILEDGTIKAVSNKVGDTVHLKAENFLRHVGELAGGETTRQRRKEGMTHTHTHNHETETH